MNDEPRRWDAGFAVIKSTRDKLVSEPSDSRESELAKECGPRNKPEYHHCARVLHRGRCKEDWTTGGGLMSYHFFGG